MAINPDIRDQAYQFFIQEAPALLQRLETGLLTLRTERSTAKVHELMRAAHSIKGGAASVDLEAIATLAHRLENILKALYNEEVDIDTDLETQLLCAYDYLRLPLTEQITTGDFDATQALSLAEPLFTQLEERLSDALAQVERYIPSSSDLGVNIALSIFEVDVAQGLERLANVIAHPQNYEVAGELRAQAEVFSGFAMLLDLPGFGAIAETAIAALDAHPERVLDITRLALADFQAGREAVLQGDNTQGGSPSAALLALATGELNGNREIGAWEEGQVFSPSLPDPICANPIPNSQFSISLLEEVFGSPQDMDVDWVAEASSVPDAVVEKFPSLEEIFGNTVETYETEAAASSALVHVDTSLLPSVTCIDNAFPEQPQEQGEHQDTPETIEAAVQAIGQLFERLPSIENTPEVVSASFVETPVKPKVHKEKPTTDQTVTPKLTLRVDLERLERMNNLVGELTINRNSLALQNEQLQNSLGELLNRFTRFQKQVGQLQELSDQMIVGASVGTQWSHELKVGRLNVQHFNVPEPSKNENTYGKQPANLQTSTLQGQLTLDKSQFDTLEMDSYGVLHSRLHGILEEMAQLEEAVDDIALFARATNQTLEQQRQMQIQLRDELMWARMLPVGEVLNRFPRVLRDLSIAYHKPANLKLNGTGVLVDRAVLEKLYDPLVHLLRNAFDHGIEPPDFRQQQGKPEQGQIEISAYHKGNQTIIEVKDDGRGIEPQLIRNRALERGFLSAEQLSKLDDAEVIQLIFEPGFTTANQVTELSGRGVGLDLLRDQMRSLKGTVTLTSTPGIGTTFTLRLPLTLTIAKLLICTVGSSSLAFPAESIEEIVIPKPRQTKQSGKKRFLYWREQLVPVYRVADLLNYSCSLADTSPANALMAVPSPEDWALPMLVFKQGQQVFALEIEHLIAEQELVIKPFSAAIKPPTYTYGCTILGDGSLIPVIDGIELLVYSLAEELQNWDQKNGRTGEQEHFTVSPLYPLSSSSDQQSQTPSYGTGTKATSTLSTILVVDDAVTLRRTLALSLERAGFRVVQARDGREAIEQLQKHVSTSLVICDIEMPNMNGFDFLNYRRQNPQLSKIPVIMLTSRSNNKHRWLAMHLGATAYFSKPYIEQTFLRAIQDIIGNQQSVIHNH
jgi:two-component system, chemotaxis family, sensor histidine kinase and response regulator PixL